MEKIIAELLRKLHEQNLDAKVTTFWQGGELSLAIVITGLSGKEIKRIIGDCKQTL